MPASTSTATATDISRLLGDVDPLVLDRILETGASADEIGEALRVVEQEHGFGVGEEPYEPSSSRVAEVRAILEELDIVEGDEDDQI